jgi:hypothetical protein
VSIARSFAATAVTQQQLGARRWSVRLRAAAERWHGVSYLLLIYDIVTPLFKKPREARALLRAKNQIKSAALTTLGHLDQIRKT